MGKTCEGRDSGNTALMQDAPGVSRGWQIEPKAVCPSLFTRKGSGPSAAFPLLQTCEIFPSQITSDILETIPVDYLERRLLFIPNSLSLSLNH